MQRSKFVGTTVTEKVVYGICNFLDGIADGLLDFASNMKIDDTGIDPDTVYEIVETQKLDGTVKSRKIKFVKGENIVENIVFGVGNRVDEICDKINDAALKLTELAARKL